MRDNGSVAPVPFWSYFFFMVHLRLVEAFFRTFSGSLFEMCDPFGTNSLPTFCETPPKPPGVWAAAAIKRAWAFERGGMGSNLFDLGVDVDALELVSEVQGGGLGGECGGNSGREDPAE